ncbi:MAG TPA: hypothetical protein VIC26_05525 [Marinagarivorans sp.]
MQRECPYCAEKIQRRARVCRFCSTKIDPLYVENPAANKQICKIMAWYEEGTDSEAIAVKMNESGELTLDSHKSWTGDRVQTIVSSFSESGLKAMPASSAPPRRITSRPSATEGERREWYQTGWVWLWIGLGMLVLISIVNGSGSGKPSEAEISACKNLIWQHNRYEPSRMRYAGTESGAIIIDYTTPTYGNYWKLRCQNGNPQVWAQGASMWMDI